MNNSTCRLINPTKSEIGSSQSEAECSKETASERKLGSMTPTRTTEYYEDESSISYCLVELSSLMNTFQKLHNCKKGKLVYNDEQAKWYGNTL